MPAENEVPDGSAADFELIETMLQEAGGEISLLERHLHRLEASARQFGFAYDEAAVCDTLARELAGRSGDRLRVRLLLAADGALTVTSTPLPAPTPDALMRYAISETRVSSTDPFLRHKTTRRELYDREWKHYADLYGADEVIYLNERGEVTEGSRTTVFIARGGDADTLFTPPLSSGLLPGTLRADLLASGRACEAVLHVGDLEVAEAVYLGNSVRGLVRAAPIASTASAAKSRPAK